MAVERLENIQTVPFSGSRTILVNDSDTLQTIAKRHLGDDELWPYIADLNGINDNTTLIPGSELLIPIFSGDRIQYVKDRYFVDLNVVKNPYGVDFRLSESGDLMFGDNEDFALVGGVENVLQAVRIRVTSVVGSVLKHTSVGLASYPGSPGTELSIRYMKMHIRFAILQDPRIETVDNILVYNRGTVLAATVFFRLVGYDDMQQTEVGL